jgi:membrane protein DedA with SNARE-associated domain
MQDAINTLMLICASTAALAFGVLAAYWLCRAGFAALRLHARSVVLGAADMQRQSEPQAARLT